MWSVQLPVYTLLRCGSVSRSDERMACALHLVGPPAFENVDLFNLFVHYLLTLIYIGNKP